MTTTNQLRVFGALNPDTWQSALEIRDRLIATYPNHDYGQQSLAGIHRTAASLVRLGFARKGTTGTHTVRYQAMFPASAAQS